VLEQPHREVTTRGNYGVLSHLQMKRSIWYGGSGLVHRVLI